MQADAYHRGHAIIEQTIAELKNGPLAHLPSGSYPANAAWVACAVIAFNLARAAAVAAGLHLLRWASLRTKLINVPARIATSGRRQVLHLPTRWPWQPAWKEPLDNRHRPTPPDQPLTTQPATAQPRTPVEKPGKPASTPHPNADQPPQQPIRAPHHSRRWIRAE